MNATIRKLLIIALPLAILYGVISAYALWNDVIQSEGAWNGDRAVGTAILGIAVIIPCLSILGFVISRTSKGWNYFGGWLIVYSSLLTLMFVVVLFAVQWAPREGTGNWLFAHPIEKLILMSIAVIVWRAVAYSVARKDRSQVSENKVAGK